MDVFKLITIIVICNLYLCDRHRFRGFAKKKNSNNPRLLWKWVGPGLTRIFFFFFGKSTQNSPKPVLIFWSSIPYMCILTVYALQKVVGYYDLSVLSMSVMGLDRVRSIQFFLDFWNFWNFFNFAKPLSYKVGSLKSAVSEYSCSDLLPFLF